MVLGNVLIVVNALSYSLFLVLSKNLLRRIDSLAATVVLLSFGSVIMLIPGLPALRGFDPAHPGLAETRYTVTLDGGCGFGGPLLAACLSPDGEILHRIEV